MHDNMNLLGTYAWCPELSNAIVSNVLHDIEPCIKAVGVEGVTIMFPECGSAFHELEVVRTLAERGHTIARVVFMDSAVASEWMVAWHQILQVRTVDIVVLDSYVALWQWAHEERYSPHSVLVVYINGAIRFTPYYCGQNDPEECAASASRFWDWCHQFAINRVPLNYVRHSALRIAGCTTWSDLAATFAPQSGAGATTKL